MKLRGYQEAAIDHLHANPRAGLFLDMGLGKTATVLCALTPDHLPAIAIAPKRVAETVWPAEARLWRPDLRVSLVAGSPAKRAEALAAPADLYVLSRDNIGDVVGKAPWRTVVLDELSSFKSRASKRWAVARRLCKKAEYVWGLTGTPNPNGYLDLWSQLALLDNGERLGTTLGGYRSRYFTPGRRLPNGIITEYILNPDADKEILSKLEDICLSMETEGRVQLPPITYNQVEVDMGARARQVYKTLKRELVVDMEMCGMAGEVHTADTAAALSNRLSQISAGFLYHDERLNGDTSAYDLIHTAKISALREIIDGTGSPVLVFYRYTAEREMIEQEFGSLATPITRKGAIEDWNDGNVPVLVAHPASAGHGLNLQHGGHTIVWTSLPWSLEEWEQGNKRLARSGQKNPVVIHYLTTPRTVDGSIKKALDQKTSVQQALLEHLESPI